MIRALTLGLALAAGTATACWADRDWSHKDWALFVGPEPLVGVERVRCQAITGPEGGPFLTISHTGSATAPPAGLPAPAYDEPGLRGMPTLAGAGARLRFSVDGGVPVEAVTEPGITEEGIPFARAVVAPGDRRTLLQAMRRGNRLVVSQGGERLLDASLSGFTAVYLKMAERCGFSPAGVVD